MRVILTRQDITEISCDALVNAANSSLLGGGGVDGAIHKKAGPELTRACAEIGGCPTGEARITLGYRLPAKYVIHAVGPVWKDGERGEQELLRKTYSSVLELAQSMNLEHLAFPNISTGIYRFPKNLAAEIAIAAATNALRSGQVKIITFACFEEENFELYRTLLQSEKVEHLISASGKANA